MAIIDSLQTTKRIVDLERKVEDLETVESQSVNDPVVALNTAVGFLRQRECNWISVGDRGRDHSAYQSIGSMTYVNALNGNAKINSDRLYPYLSLDSASSEYFYQTGSAGVWGHFGVSQSLFDRPGATVGVWCNASGTSTPTNQSPFSAYNHYSSATSWGILIQSSASYKPQFSVSPDGTWTNSIELLMNDAMPFDEWIFMVFTWEPSTEMYARMYTKTDTYVKSHTSSIPSSMYAATTGYIGAYTDASNVKQTWKGDIGLTFFSPTLFTDAEITYLHAVSRNIYGV